MKLKKYSFKQFLCVALSMVISILCFSLSFLFTPNRTVYLSETTQNSAFAATSENNESENQESTDFTILKYVSISQEGHIFSADDFSTVTINEIEYPAIYTNNTISISNSTADVFKMLNINNLTDFSLYEKTINGKKYYVFNVNTIEHDTSYIVSMECTINIETTRGIVQQTYRLTFCIVQTTTNFRKANSQYESENSINWHYTTSTGKDFDVSAPETNQVYSTLILSFPAGSQINPVYCNFIYLGESYTLKRYYNSENHIITSYQYTEYKSIKRDETERIEKNEFKEEVIDDVTSLSDAMKLTLNKSGTYAVTIYDKTSTIATTTNNKLDYSFNIENASDSSTGLFYINVFDSENDKMIMNGQIINSNAIVNFVNITKSTLTVSKVDIERSYRPTDNENKTETTTYSPANLPEQIIIDKDGVYQVAVYDRQLTKIKTYNFTILKSIRSSFTIEGEQISTKDGDAVNTPIQTILTTVIGSSYNSIPTATMYSVTITVAKSSPSITGINNNSGTSNPVTLTIHGVGNIEVFASIDGKTLDLGNKTFENGSTLPTFTEKGSYYVRITDEMGIIATKSFSITIQLNTASIILISIAAAAILFIIVFVIVSRTRIKVR